MGQVLESLASEVDLRSKATLLKQGFVLVGLVCGIGPNVTGIVARLQQIWQACAVIGGCMGHHPGPDQAMALVDVNVAFVAKSGNHQLDASKNFASFGDLAIFRPIAVYHTPPKEVGFFEVLD